MYCQEGKLHSQMIIQIFSSSEQRCVNAIQAFTERQILSRGRCLNFPGLPFFNVVVVARHPHFIQHLPESLASHQFEIISVLSLCKFKYISSAM